MHALNRCSIEASDQTVLTVAEEHSITIRIIFKQSIYTQNVIVEILTFKIEKRTQTQKKNEKKTSNQNVSKFSQEE